MHDRNGKELKVGDTVIIKCVVEQLFPTPDYCNVNLRNVYPRKPDGLLDLYITNAACVEKVDAE